MTMFTTNKRKMLQSATVSDVTFSPNFLFYCFLELNTPCMTPLQPTDGACVASRDDGHVPFSQVEETGRGSAVRRRLPKATTTGILCALTRVLRAKSIRCFMPRIELHHAMEQG